MSEIELELDDQEAYIVGVFIREGELREYDRITGLLKGLVRDLEPDVDNSDWARMQLEVIELVVMPLIEKNFFNKGETE